MREHSADAKIQAVTCGILHMMSPFNRNNTIADTVCLAFIILTMKDHALNATLQYTACAALQGFAINDDNKRCIAAMGGMDVILSAMKAHPKDAKVQQFGCGALFRLAVNEDNIMLVFAAGGIEAILVTMNENVHIGEVQQLGCGALAVLSLLKLMQFKLLLQVVLMQYHLP